jgi:hypothetical protein
MMIYEMLTFCVFFVFFFIFYFFFIITFVIGQSLSFIQLFITTSGLDLVNLWHQNMPLLQVKKSAMSANT